MFEKLPLKTSRDNWRVMGGGCRGRNRDPEWRQWELQVIIVLVFTVSMAPFQPSDAADMWTDQFPSLAQGQASRWGSPCRHGSPCPQGSARMHLHSSQNDGRSFALS